jgi:endonuclease III
MTLATDTWIRDRLVEHGRRLFEGERFVGFTKHEAARNEAANALLNDLTGHPHAFVLACVMDRQVKAEKAWLIPYRLQQKLGGDFSIQRLALLTVPDVKKLMREPEPLHRFVDKMAGFFHAAVQWIVHQYNGDASRIWRDKPSSADLVYRFLEFDGVGPKIASMAANILAREFKLPFADHYSIDISADVHVRRVFGRLGLAANNASVEQLIFRARGLCPEFPGLMDLPAWEIGRQWCRPRNPRCAACYLGEKCPKTGVHFTNDRDSSLRSE